MNRRLVSVVAALMSFAPVACSGGSTASQTTVTDADGTAADSTTSTSNVTDQSGDTTATSPATTGAPRPAVAVAVGEQQTTSIGDFREVIPPPDCPAAPTTTAAPRPVITQPSQPPVDVPTSVPTELVVTDLIVGTGTRKATTGDVITFYYVGVSIPGGEVLDSNYTEDTPVTTQLGVDPNLPGWTQGMEGVTAGTRRQLDIPASLALGDDGSEQVPAGTSLTFVIDVVAVLPGPPIADANNEPAANYPPLPPAGEIAFISERAGDRCALAEPGDAVFLNVKVVDAKSGDIIESSWDRGRAAVITLDDGGFPGLVEAVIGMGVGEVRSIALIPPTTGAATSGSGATPEPGVDGIQYLVEFVGFS